jgi:oligopeptide/dipeptide ABC transporter ATP-binding protein
MSPSEQPIVEVENLVKTFDIRRSFHPRQQLRAVNDVSFHIRRGETFGLVGESGCGKSTLARTILRLYEPTSGTVRFAGVDITAQKGAALAAHQRRMQMIFQDPYSSLNPYRTVGQLVAEPLLLQEKLSRRAREQRVGDMLREVGLSAADQFAYPRAFSGGQRQRVSIARALIGRPELVLCDEPISALDVSIQAQIVNLLEDLQRAFGLTYLFVAHDLSMVRHISHRIAVMYMGEIVEISSAEDLYGRPLHPYTQTLLSAIPIPDPRRARAARRIPLQGEPPNPLARREGCAFCSRCPMAKPVCREGRPPLRDVDAKHRVACFEV